MNQQYKRLATFIPGTILAGLVTVSPLVSAAPTQTQIDALRDLYTSLNGQDWTDKTGWNTLADPCAGWFGVSCDAGGNNVTGFHMTANNAFGSIPASISGLTELQELVITGVGLNNTAIPSSIGSLTKLRGLYLNDNSLTGNIPTEIGQLSQLQSLVLDDNNLTGSIPAEIMSLTRLYAIRLHGNFLSGQIPDGFNNLPTLRALTLNRNGLSGEIPASIATLPELSEINLDWNALHTSDATLITVINQNLSSSVSDNYIDTQTLDASPHRTPEIGETAINLYWDQRNTTPETEGGYNIYIATASTGPYALNQTVENKSSDTTRVDGLSANTTYFFQIRSYTSPHEANLQNSNLESSGSFYNPLEVTTLPAGSGNEAVGDAPNPDNGDSEEESSNSSSGGGGGSLAWLFLALIPFGFRQKR